jgi:hypothetical protein
VPDSLLTRHVLPQRTPSLGLGAPSLEHGRPGPPGTLHLLGPLGGVAATVGGQDPDVDFGRALEAAVRLGPADPSVSRKHGTIRHDGHGWWLANTGALPIRVHGEAEPLLRDQRVRLQTGFIPLFFAAQRRTHVLELLISGPTEDPDDDGARLATRPRPVWGLSDTERLVLTAVFAPYLRRDDDARPTVTADVADELTALTGQEWAAKRVARVVDTVRVRLAGRGVDRMLLDQAPAEMLRHHLYRALAVDSATLGPRDLDLLDPDASPAGAR